MASRLLIRSENSAQGMTAKPNPFVEVSIALLIENHLRKRTSHSANIADQGCGKLRHLKVLLKYFSKVVVVDTALQLTRTQELGGDRTTVEDDVAKLRRRYPHLRVMTNQTFARSTLGLDIIFNVCVFDVVLPGTRRELVGSAYRNLRTGGLYCVIVPRNDQSITRRCVPSARYKDGYAFRRNGFSTFYKNFDDSGEIANLLRRAGFEEVADLSRYRQICLIAQRPRR